MTDRTITEIPLDAIVEHPDQPRYGVGDVQALADSIENVGLLEPITVVGFEANADGPAGYRVLAGHRRVAAMRHLGRTEIPAVELAAMISGGRSPDVKALDEISAIMASNVARESLTPLEEARGYQTMLDFGLKAADVAKLAGTKKKRVEGLAGAAAALGDHVDELAGVQLTVEEMETLARHSGNKTAYKKLVAELGKSGFEWAARTADQAKAKAEVKAAATAIIKAAGVELVKDNEFYQAQNERLLHLTDAEGNDLDVEVHNASCAGACAAIHGWGDDAERAVEWGCLDYEKHGHLQRGRAAYKRTPEELAKEEAYKQREAANEIATDLRRDFLKAALAQKKLPAAYLELAAPLIWDGVYRDRALAAKLLGWTDGDWHARAGQAAAALAALGLTQAERNVEHYFDVAPWDYDDRGASVRYLHLLEEQGYELHGPETDFITRCEVNDKVEREEEAAEGPCPVSDPDCEGEDGECHYACEAPEAPTS